MHEWPLTRSDRDHLIFAGIWFFEKEQLPKFRSSRPPQVEPGKLKSTNLFYSGDLNKGSLKTSHCIPRSRGINL